MSKRQEMGKRKKGGRQEGRKERKEVEKPNLPSGKTLTVTLFNSEWKSSKGGMSTMNRELAIQLAKHLNVEVYVYLPKCSEEDKKDAASHSVQLIEAEELPGFEPIDWLTSLPEGHFPHWLIGHGLHIGRQIPLIMQHHDCKWIQVVYTAPEELGMYKSYEEAIFRGEQELQTEVKLCELADQVVAVGPKLADAYSRYLRFCGKDVMNLTPSIFMEFVSVKQATEERRTFCILVFGGVDGEDFLLKGYDIAVQAVAKLEDSSYQIMFVGAPAGKEDEVAEKLLQHGIHPSQLTVRRFNRSRENLAELFCEVDLAIMPSRTEGFGFTALEALSAGLPVLVSGNSGFGDALKRVPFGMLHVVDSEDPKEWAKAIKIVRQKDREVRLAEADFLREKYASTYSWQEQCDWLVERMLHLSFGNIQDKVEQEQNQVENENEKTDNLGKLKETSQEAAPPEILVRGGLALEAYNKALAEGTTFDRRVPIMLIGRDRSGKTSLKKSLRGELFNPHEKSTVGIDVDPAHFELSTEIWTMSEKDQEPNSGTSISYEYHVGRAAVEHMTQTRRGSASEEMTPEATPSKKVPRVKTVSASTNITTHDPAEVGTVSFSSPKTSIQEMQKNEDTKLHIPNDVQSVMIKLLENNSEVEDEEVHAVLWDFAGQSVYYTTHPIFLTPRAIYLLAYDLSKNPHEKAQPVLRRGLFQEFTDSCGLELNSDYLDFWMSSVASLASQEETDQARSESEVLPDKLPAVFLVCTHADTPYDSLRRPKTLANELYGSLRNKPYKRHLRNLFVVDNTKSGRGSECQGVKHLREELLTVAKQLPQMKEPIPIKWLNYERKLQAKRKLKKWIDLHEAKRIASEECNIVDEKGFQTVLDFLHDKRILIHFSDTPKLGTLVVLDPQWLVDVFKKVITIPPYDSKENEFEELWRKLQSKGILEKKLLHHVWKTLSFDEETTESLLEIMEKFSLLCSWPSSDASCGEQYLMPSMLTTYPTEDIMRLVEDASAQLPPLFVKFESGLVPPGLFPRLVLLFLQWGKESRLNPVKPLLYHNFARCFISQDTSQSVILRCLSSFIEVAVHRGNDTQESGAECPQSVMSGSVDVFAGSVCRQLELILESMRKEFCWLKNMRYKLSFICPVCCQGGVGCKKEEYLHFLSLPELRNKKAIDCNESAGALITRVDKRQFAPWFAFPGYQLTGDEHNEESLANLEETETKSMECPPQLSVKIPKMSDLPCTSRANWNTVELPIDILLMTVEDEELLSCYLYLEEPFRAYEKKIGHVYFGSIGNGRGKKRKIGLMKCFKGSADPGSSLSAVQNAVRVLRPKAVFSVGACSGLKREKTKLGDVVVSSKLITPSYKTPPGRDIGNLIRYIADGWKAPLEKPAQREVRVHSDGVFLSIQTSDGGWPYERIIQEYSEATAVEMEGGGVFAAAHDLKTEWVVVKGIKDYADGSQSSSDEWGTFASVMAASVVANILSDGVIFEDWPHYNPDANG